MSRKATFTKQEILDCAIKIVRKKGFEALSARELSREMGCSTSPIFTIYNSFESVKADTMQQVFAILNRYLSGAINYTPVFREYGRRLIYFAKQEPMLFRAVHLANHSGKIHINDIESHCKLALMEEFGFNDEQATFLLDQVYYFADGLASHMAFGTTVLSDDEINLRLSAAFRGAFFVVKQGIKVPVETPHLNENGEPKYVINVDAELDSKK